MFPHKRLTPVSIFLIGLVLGLAAGGGATALFFRGLSPVSGVAEGAALTAEKTGPVPEADGRVYQGYLGVYDNHLAIYDAVPPGGMLQYVLTDYEVREDLRPQLEKGIPFTDMYDMLRLLENYTS
ncbi:MAG: hypothetical protein GX167_07330 [Firmicutes bacterium]|jgi:hypothetical protein|nr:hypothetical protein [Bacillota bacterium]